MSKILKVKARQVFDSRGNPTIESEIFTKNNSAKAICPSGASTGTYEAFEKRDTNNKQYLGKSVLSAVYLVNTIVSKKIKGFIGIGSAPEFLEKLIWNKFSKKIKQEIISKGLYLLKNGDYEYPITYQIIKDGKKNKVLNKKILSKIFVTMIHGSKDEVVPTIFSKKVLKLFPNAKKKLIIIKKGDHSLSDKKSLKRITTELKTIVSNMF